MINDLPYLPFKSRILFLRMVQVFLVLFLITFFSNELFPQSEKDTISISELIRRMQADTDPIEISNVVVEFRPGDKKYAQNKVFYWVYSITPASADPKRVYFYDCEFNTGKKAPLILENWEFRKMNMIGCKVNTNFSFENCKQFGRYPLRFENNSFFDNLQFEGEDSLTSIQFLNCRFRKQLLMETYPGEFEMDECIFDADSLKFGRSVESKTLFQLSFKGQKAEEISILNSLFLNNGLTNVYSMDLEGVEAGKIILLNTRMESLNFTDIQVEKSILIDSLFISGYIGVQNFDFPESNTNIPWYNIAGEKLSIFQRTESDQIIPYQAKTKGQLLNTLLYNDLISAYNKLNAIYHSRGDIHSANKSYVEMKTIETRRQKYLLDEQWDFNVYINYKLNVFLSDFSDFATNPGKSLIQSLWWLLIFTLLYLFTYSKWDGMDYKYFVDQYSRFSEYIKENKNIEDVYGKNYSEKIKDIESLEEKYIRAGKKVPRMLRLTGIPLYHLGKFRYSIMPRLILFFNFQPEKWEELEERKSTRIKNNFLIFLISLFFILYVLIVKFFAAFVLSLNSFVVIGYGNLPEKGLAKYLSVFEGIIGWFLLTIFTITLLSQVLQTF